MADKPAILQDTQFTVREGWAYRFLRGTSIQLNKLMFASLILLAIWLLYAWATGATDCVSGTPAQDDGIDVGEKDTCHVFLTPTASFLAGMAILSFIGSILAGLLGLVVGKNIVAMTPTQDEVGARSNESAEPEPSDDDGTSATDSAESTEPPVEAGDGRD